MIEDNEMENFPLPQLYDWNKPFFEGGLTGKLKLQRCSKCGEIIYYPRIACPECLSIDYEWIELSGRGIVYSFSIVWKPGYPAFDPLVPIILAAIKLEEGPMMISNIINCPIERVYINMPVGVVFDKINDNIALPKFQPV